MGHSYRYTIKDFPLNKKFGSWEVVGTEIEKDTSNSRKIKCMCTCGTVRDVNILTLLRGKSKGCGCEKFKNYKHPEHEGVLKDGRVFTTGQLIDLCFELTGEKIHRTTMRLRLKSLSPDEAIKSQKWYRRKLYE